MLLMLLLIVPLTCNCLSDVLVLAIRRYPEMCTITSFVINKGANHQGATNSRRTWPCQQPFFQHFTQSQALTTLEVFQGSKGKVACWKMFFDADESITDVLGKLGQAEQADDDIKREVERFVCHFIYRRSTELLSKSSGGSSLERNKHSTTDFHQPTLHWSRLYCAHTSITSQMQ